MMRFLIFTLFSLLLINCTTKNEFFILNKLTHNDKIHFTEYVVMSNPHRNKDNLLVQVKDYMKRYNQKHQIDKKKVIYTCFFFKETWNTPRDYEEDPSGYFDFDEIGHHMNDLVAVIRYSKKRGWIFEIKTEDEWKYYRNISLE